MTSHGGQHKILLTITHEAVGQIKRFVANVHAGLNHVMQTAPQLSKPQRWFGLVRHIVERILASQFKAAPITSRLGGRVTEENRFMVWQPRHMTLSPSHSFRRS